MKCPKCGNSVFKGQFRCEKCRAILTAIDKPEPKQAPPKAKPVKANNNNKEK